MCLVKQLRSKQFNALFYANQTSTPKESLEDRVRKFIMKYGSPIERAG